MIPGRPACDVGERIDVHRANQDAADQSLNIIGVTLATMGACSKSTPVGLGPAKIARELRGPRSLWAIARNTSNAALTRNCQRTHGFKAKLAIAARSASQYATPRASAALRNSGSPSSGIPRQGPCPIRDSVVVNISACHAEDLGSIPGRGVLCAQRLRKHRTAAQRALPAEVQASSAQYEQHRQEHCEARG